SRCGDRDRRTRLRKGLLGAWNSGHTLGGVTTHHRAQSHTMDNLFKAKEPTAHVFGLGEETEVPGGRVKVGIEPPTMEVRGKCANF
ncbi:hypothetical protein AMELA_G00062020, partial [Ameiurus melas]